MVLAPFQADNLIKKQKTDIRILQRKGWILYKQVSPYVNGFVRKYVDKQNDENEYKEYEAKNGHCHGFVRKFEFVYENPKCHVSKRQLQSQDDGLQLYFGFRISGHIYKNGNHVKEVAEKEI